MEVIVDKIPFLGIDVGLQCRRSRERWMNCQGNDHIQWMKPREQLPQ